MKRILFVLGIAALTFTACQPDNGEMSSKDLTGIWVNTLVPGDYVETLTITKDGNYSIASVNWKDEGKYTYEDGKLFFDEKEADYFEVNSVCGGNAMTWYYEEDETGHKDFAFIWFRKEAKFSKKLKEGRWNAYIVPEDYIASYIFKGQEFDLYITAWGVHLKGTYTHENGVLTLNITESYKAWEITAGYKGWAAGGMDPETFELKSPYKWYSFDKGGEDWSLYAEPFITSTFAIDTDNLAWGGLVGRSFGMHRVK